MKNTGIRQLGTFVLLLAVALGASAKTNVLFIAVDDLRTELGCYGVKSVHSPNIDQLAKTGVLFERAYCQVAVCNPSRVSLLTGLRPDSSRVWDLVTRFRETVPAVVTLPQHFKAHGYRALSYGKIFHNPWPDNASWSEDHKWPENARLWSDDAKARLARHREEMKLAGKSAAAIQRIRGPATEIVDLADGEHTDGAIADQAIAAMRELAGRDEAFFLAAGFVRPHLPFVVPRKYWDLYDRSSIELARDGFIPRGSPGFALNTLYELRDYMDFAGTADPRDGSLSEAQQRRLKHGYLAAVSLIDAQIGRLMAELEDLGLAESTVVVLWSDHGWKLGEHNSWCKQTNYEIDTRVPLIIRSPGAKANGKRTAALTELLDLYPTLCELAGIPAPKHVEGTSLAPLLEDASGTVKAAAFSQFRRRDQGRELMGYAMRTERYRFVEWLDRASAKLVANELYDHQTDPGESRNIAAGEGERIEELRDRLWSALPRPEPVKARRPKLTIQNQSRQAVGVFWERGDEKPKFLKELPVGGTHVIDTTLGHVFRIKGTRTSFQKTVTVKRAEQTFTLRSGNAGQPERPNIVFLMADDWSSPHAGILGDPAVKTPNFDRVAREGMLFRNAFVSTPSCTPSRLSVLTGQHHWRLREGDSLGGSLRTDYEVYTDRLAESGYKIGRFGKGVWPSKHAFRKRDSFGEKFDSFEAFLAKRKLSEAFCFWYGGQDPHRPYELGVGERSGIDPATIRVPANLPDNEVVRSDLADYFWEVERFDNQVGEVLKALEKSGELENTIVVVSGDNGMPFPGAKATLHDLGTRVPLAIRWGAEIKGGGVVDKFVSLCDLAPTFLEAAGLSRGSSMTGRSLLALLKKGGDGLDRSFVLTGMERHVYSWPARGLRTEDFLYIRNFAPAAWMTGEVRGKEPNFDFAAEPWPSREGAFSFNIDPSPTKQLLRLERDAPGVAEFAAKILSRPPDEELYDLRSDPAQTNNIAGDKDSSEIRGRLVRQLSAELRASGDPRFALPNHATLDLQGWTVHLNESLWFDEPKAVGEMLALLSEQLARVVAVVPDAALKHLRTVPIWINPPFPGGRPGAAYHPDLGWLRKNGRDPIMAKAIEITNTKIFAFEDNRMPFLLLHELAHAYHDQVLGFGNPKVKALFGQARDSGGYDLVDRYNGRKIVKDKAYALSNEKEYFAETTEAYFGKNDFYPFNRSELKTHDPAMHDLLAELWKVNAK
ncbi:MAG: sulfatase-like hydrolase/transferase [Verrucomicrobiae bacterium]|nr:sulfatase-like hydrolase/transferase [Verrucomicrobiae bacterium]